MADIHFKARQTLAGQQVENSFYFEGTGVTTGNTDAIAQAIANAWNVDLVARCSADWSLDSIIWRVLPGLPGQPFQPANVPALPLVGTNVEQGLPTTVSLTLSQTTDGGPPYRGHLALTGFTVEAIDSDREFSAGVVADAEKFWDELETRLNAIAADINPMIVSQSSTQVPPGTTARITAVTARSIPGSRYSRKKNIGT